MAKTVRKMICVHPKIWMAYKKHLEKKADEMGIPTLTPSVDLSQYMKEQTTKSEK